jgi:hypothetical protein
MVAIDGKGHRPSFQASGLGSPRRPMVDSMNGWIAKSCLKPVCILSQIMQQPGQFRFFAKIKWRCELRGELGDVG